MVRSGFETQKTAEYGMRQFNACSAHLPHSFSAIRTGSRHLPFLRTRSFVARVVVCIPTISYPPVATNWQWRKEPSHHDRPPVLSTVLPQTHLHPQSQTGHRSPAGPPGSHCNQSPRCVQQPFRPPTSDLCTSAIPSALRPGWPLASHPGGKATCQVLTRAAPSEDGPLGLRRRSDRRCRMGSHPYAGRFAGWVTHRGWGQQGVEKGVRDLVRCDGSPTWCTMAIGGGKTRSQPSRGYRVGVRLRSGGGRGGTPGVLRRGVAHRPRGTNASALLDTESSELAPEGVFYALSGQTPAYASFRVDGHTRFLIY
jgi:hypothetical protein